ncbi:MAG: NAD-glutamate dehydrogenase [Pseudomonadota bacterium]
MPAPKRRNTDKQEALIKAISRAADRHTPFKNPEQFRRFCAEYFRNVAVDDIADEDPALLANAALAHASQARRLAPGEHALRIYNPSLGQHGWESAHTVIELVHENMPFLVDSLSVALGRVGCDIQLTIHPLIRVRRTAKGSLQDVLTRRAKTGRIESFIRFDIRRESRPEQLEAIRDALERTLGDIRAAVADWTKMRAKMAEAIAEIERIKPANTALRDETIELLRWLNDDKFTYLGYREYRLDNSGEAQKLRPVARSALGVKRIPGRRGRAHEVTTPMERFRRAPDIVLLTKANSRATVHRDSNLDYVGIKTYGPDGEPNGERRFIGLLTSQAYSEHPATIPLVRGKVDRILDRAGLDPTGHRGKALIHILSNYPRDELFQATVSDLLRTTTGILNLQDRRRVKLFLRRDPFHRFYSCLVFVPREKYNTEVRQKTEQILLAALNGNTVESTAQVSEATLARVHLLVYADGRKKPHISIRQIEATIADAVVTWRDRLRTALADNFGEERGADLFETYGGVFPLAYEEDHNAQQACHDIQRLDALLSGDASELKAFDLHIEPRGPVAGIRFRVFRFDDPIALSDALPLLENLGLRVINERPYHLRTAASPTWIQDFEVVPIVDKSAAELRAVVHKLAIGFATQLQGHAEADGFNRLILAAGLDSRNVALIRAYAKYLLQLGLPFSQSYLEDILADHSDFASALVSWFESRFDPTSDAVAGARIERLRAVEATVRDADSLDADRALRAMLNAMQATRRCNFYWRDLVGQPAPTIAFKLATESIDEAPLPRPMHEIFVYSPRVEGVHLRAGDVARGGLRWSDRREDFRTEILGLMKAQTVKNTVIVPTGAKGGFFPKQLPTGDRDAINAEVTACYQLFVDALLSLTDNLVDGEAQRPAQLVANDGPDPYLVVAADKGTARFSDTANAIAVGRDFWLGDAFASGGSAGYDHKVMGITARGAWEAVKRHFREMGVDTQHDAFTVAGIGDMSGDVFGNGMLLSETLRLQAAFNHLHIFIDPDPDAAASFAERQRLFALPRSSWTDYDTRLISKGGGVFSRDAKSIPLSPEMRRLLDSDAQSLSAPALVSAILRMPVDLLWNGGIGTYVKATSESDADVGDRHNDALRVDAKDLRCRVIGEGGNLGLTQLARVEYAQAGGRINTDFIDNSAGVDSSDREVNIKILLRLVAEERGLRESTRNKLLAEMTDDVANLVLRNNYLQTQAISMMEARAVSRFPEHRLLIESLERSGLLNRALEHLPDNEACDERKRNGKGLTRPEISVILSYAKLDLYRRLSESPSELRPTHIEELKRYFPRALQRRYGALIGDHQLGREIITTLLTNSIVNRMGPVFPIRAEQDTGYSIACVAQSYEIARDLTGARAIWADIEQLDTRIPTDIQYSMMFEVARKLRHACYWLLRTYDAEFPHDLVDTLEAPLQRVLKDLPELMTKHGRERLKALHQQHARMGVSTRLAARVSALTYITDALEIVRLAEQRQCDTHTIAAVYFGLGKRVQLDWLRQSIDELAVEGRWQARARGTLRDSAMRAQRDLTSRVHSLNQCEAREASIDDLVASDAAGFERMLQLVDQMRENADPDFATLTVAVDEFTQLTEGD